LTALQSKYLSVSALARALLAVNIMRQYGSNIQQHVLLRYRNMTSGLLHGITMVYNSSLQKRIIPLVCQSRPVLGLKESPVQRVVQALSPGLT
jgi:hypothetical protein